MRAILIEIVKYFEMCFMYVNCVNYEVYKECGK